jgi:hypothetical protein
MILGVGIGGAVICLGAVIYSKMNPANNTNPAPAPVKGGSRHTRRVLRMRRANGTRRS